MKITISLFFILGFLRLNAQVSNTRLNNQASLQYESSDTLHILHTSIRPYLQREIRNENILDSIESSLANIHSEKFSLRINPVLQLLYLYEAPKFTGSLVTEGGVRVSADFGKKLSASFNFTGGNSEFLSWQDTMIKYTDVIPGIGTAYGKEKYSYQQYTGYISYSPNKIFNFQAGKDKQFWGDGYRSLFLSDAAPAFTFGKITANVWKLKYVSLYGFFKDTRTESHLKQDFRNKYGTFHYLSWNATKKINLSLFESIIWQGSDSSRNRNYDINYLNPVIFYRPIEYSLGSSDNAFLGFSFKWRAFKKYSLYGQLLLDEFLLKELMARNGWWGNKYGLQGGMKCLDLFNVKNLMFRAELNYVRPYTYSHASVQQNYGHFNQPLAHPLGANFMEALSILSFQYERWTFEGKIIIAKYGTDSTSNFSVGHDIFRSYNARERDYGNFIGQGVPTNLAFIDGKAEFLIDKHSGLRVEAGGTIRFQTSPVKNNRNVFVYFGIKTLLDNFYNDF